MANTAKILINTVVRVIPIGLYLATLLSSMLMDNNKGIILFLGHVLNDLIGLAYRMMFKPPGKLQCAVVRVGDVFYTMPSPYVQVVAYYFTFFMADMYMKGDFNNVKFIVLLLLLLITIWSRMDVECKTMLDVVFAFSMGVLVGLAYYFIVKDYYDLSDDELMESESKHRNEEDAINDVFKFFN